VSLLNIIKDGIGGLIGPVGDIIDNLHTSDEEKAAAKQKLEELLQKERMQQELSLRKELEAKERVLVAELNQGDGYTKRARPTVVYAGLAFILFNYVIAPLVLPNQQSLQLPVEFWAAWGGIVSTWSIGRSFEKRGVSNQATQTLTGSKRLSLLD